LTEAARLAAKTDKVRASELLSEASAEAQRISSLTSDKARALLAVATQMAIVDANRLWEAVLEATRAANAAQDAFSGEDGELLTRLQTPGSTSVSSFSVAGFDVASVFTALAKQDFSRAITLAADFRNEAPRASATLAAARAVLEPKKKDSRSKAKGQ
jgi:hypothetical protein